MIGLTEECKQTAAADYQKGYFYVHLISIAILNVWDMLPKYNESSLGFQMGSKVKLAPLHLEFW